MTLPYLSLIQATRSDEKLNGRIEESDVGSAVRTAPHRVAKSGWCYLESSSTARSLKPSASMARTTSPAGIPR
jgi:hypothetical protein